MRRENVVLAGVAAATLSPATDAVARDFPVRVEAPPAPLWAGWYIGAHVGAAWQQAHTDPYGNSTTSTGFIGGGQIGHNWQRGNLVYGLEGDISGLTGKGTSNSGGLTYSNQITWLSTIRARMGLTVGDTMVYVTGGLAIGGIRNTISCGCGVVVYSDTRTRVGWTIGGGIEHKWDRHWSIALEGLFVDLGRGYLSPTSAGKANFYKTSNQVVIGRIKTNYRF